VGLLACAPDEEARLRWVIDERALGEVLFFTGLNFSGQRAIVRFFPGGRRQGDDVDGARVKSFGIIAQPGLRVTLATASSDEDWEDLTWRAVTIVEGSTFTSQSGKPAVQIPDLDVMDAPDARRTDLEFQVGYPQVKRLVDGRGWTYGHRGTSDLKGNLRTIRVDVVG